MIKIENTTLTRDNTGHKVTYVPRHAHGNANHKDAECGVISSWNDKFVFVDYRGNIKATPPELLVWGQMSKYSSHYKNLSKRSKQIYDKCYNPELTSKEIKAFIDEELRTIYRLAFADGNRQVKLKENFNYGKQMFW